MEHVDVKTSLSLNTNGLQKSAIIYRNDSAHFIYVCFHCGGMFDEINETLLHIESHFRVASVTVDNHFTTTAAPENVDIKSEVLDGEEDSLLAATFLPAEAEFGYSTDDSKYSQKRVAKERIRKVTTVDESSKKSKRKPCVDLPYRCHKCSVACRNMTLLRSHLKSHENGDDLLSIYKCKECDEYFRNSCSLRIHVLGTHLKTKRINCNVCSAQFGFAQSRQLVEHLQLHNGTDNSLWLDLCEGIDHKNKDVTSYEEIHSFTDPQHACEFCTQKFYIKCNLDTHIKTIHSGERRLQCSLCSSIFTAPKVSAVNV